MCELNTCCNPIFLAVVSAKAILANTYAANKMHINYSLMCSIINGNNYVCQCIYFNCLWYFADVFEMDI